jgi:putative spermidine/putrescine transport system substrate-binding protein
MPPAWRAFVRRGADGAPAARGAAWASPHTWGATVIAYRRDVFREAGLTPIADWSDLLQPRLVRQVCRVPLGVTGLLF